MPVLRSIRARFAAEKPLKGLRVAACLHVTAETANLVQALRAGGAKVALCAANPLSTQDDVVAALGKQAAVFAKHGEDLDAYVAHVAEVAATKPHLVLDDGADLLALTHQDALGGMEETTTGLVRLRSMELGCPVLAVNEAQAERAFNDRYGTGQSTLDGILRATNVLLAGRTVVVLGYGWTGQGIVERARGAGAQVVVCEVDPLRALEARMEGHEVMTALAAAERGDIFITVTGSRGVLRREHFERMKDGAILANAGHFDVEIDLAELRELADDVREVLPLVEQFTLPGGRRLILLASGRVVNLAAADGHPAQVMDVSFALQALCAELLACEAKGMAPGVYPVPPDIDREVARLKLASLGVEIDELSEDQLAYLSGWRGSP
jgi:adenosylhomocysteinase